MRQCSVLRPAVVTEAIVYNSVMDCMLCHLGCAPVSSVDSLWMACVSIFLHKVGGANIRTKAWYLLLAACVCVESKVFKPDKVVGLDVWGVDTRSRQRCGEDNSRPADICWNSVGASKRSYERKDEQVETWKSLQHCAMGNDFCVI